LRLQSPKEGGEKEERGKGTSVMSGKRERENEPRLISFMKVVLSPNREV
jgi:hypothetical protein